MGQSLSIIITLCYQFESDFYSNKLLKNTIISATQAAEDMLTDVNMAFEDIEEAIHSTEVRQNVTTSIRKADIVIFEISDLNHNVMYELGIANTLGKPIILLREESSKNDLPSDVNQFIYLKYNKNRMDTLIMDLSKKIKKLYSSIDEISFVPKDIQEKIIDRYMQENSKNVFSKLDKYELVKIINSTKEFNIAFEKILSSTQKNFYYIGAVGMLSSSNEWLERYTKYFTEQKVFARVVYLHTLKDFYKIYEDEDMLVDYCFWLAQNYYLLDKKIVSINLSKDVGIWKNGMSLIVSDEKKMLISTGQFSSEYNYKGLYIEDSNIARIFKEYAKLLAFKSKNITSKKMIKFFSLHEKTNKLPSEIEKALEDDLSNLRDACEKYIDRCINN